MNDLHLLLDLCFKFAFLILVLKFSSLENFIISFSFVLFFSIVIELLCFYFLLFYFFAFFLDFSLIRVFEENEMKNTPLFICVSGLETRISIRTSLFCSLHTPSNTTRWLFSNKIIIIAMRCVFRVWSTWWIWMQQFCQACDWILVISIALRRLFAL